MIDIKKLKALVGLMVENELTEMDIEGEGEKVKLRRGPQGELHYAPPAQAPPPAAGPSPGSIPAQSEPATPPSAEDTQMATIDSPMVGTFYQSPTPDADVFVNVGDRVDSDTVVCIVEAMKVFNEIKAETSGTIDAVLIENGQPVEYGQPLFRLS